jgi:hypothetical protein
MVNHSLEKSLQLLSGWRESGIGSYVDEQVGNSQPRDRNVN